MGKRTNRHLFFYGGLFKAVVFRGLRRRGGGKANQKIALCTWFNKRNGDAPLDGRNKRDFLEEGRKGWLKDKNHVSKL